jgi:hypothetical protein
LGASLQQGLKKHLKKIQNFSLFRLNPKDRKQMKNIPPKVFVVLWQWLQNADPKISWVENVCFRSYAHIFFSCMNTGLENADIFSELTTAHEV